MANRTLLNAMKAYDELQEKMPEMKVRVLVSFSFALIG